MGWEALFADLEGEFDAAEAAELAAEVGDRTRREAARLRLVDHLRAASGSPVVVTLAHVGALRGELVDVGPDWLLVTESAARQALVPLDVVLGVAGLPPRALEPGSEGVVLAKLRLGYALRAIARDRAAVRITLADGSMRTGTIDRVGADYFTLAEHAADDVRRASAVRDVAAIPFRALVVVRSV
jgi:hypothetical protein